MLLSEITALNDEGVKLLSIGQYVKALNVFRAALDGLRNRVEGNGLEVPVPPPAMLENARLALLRVPVNVSFDEFSTSPYNSFSFYGRALLLNKDYVYGDDAFVSSTLLFNMGLACHYKGMTVANERSNEFLNRALRIYKMVLAILNVPSYYFIHTDALKLIAFAVLSNMGFIQSHNFAHQEAKLCQEQLMVILLASSQTIQIMDESEFVTFFINAAFFVSAGARNLAPAPAA
jgi:hypothetical protein